MVEDLVEFPEEDEIPVSVATNGQNLVFVGTNAALYEFNIKTKIVSFFKLTYLGIQSSLHTLSQYISVIFQLKVRAGGTEGEGGTGAPPVPKFLPT